MKLDHKLLLEQIILENLFEQDALATKSKITINPWTSDTGLANKQLRYAKPYGIEKEYIRGFTLIQTGNSQDIKTSIETIRSDRNYGKNSQYANGDWVYIATKSSDKRRIDVIIIPFKDGGIIRAYNERITYIRSLKGDLEAAKTNPNLIDMDQYTNISKIIQSGDLIKTTQDIEGVEIAGVAKSGNISMLEGDYKIGNSLFMTQQSYQARLNRIPQLNKLISDLLEQLRLAKDEGITIPTASAPTETTTEEDLKLDSVVNMKKALYTYTIKFILPLKAQTSEEEWKSIYEDSGWKSEFESFKSNNWLGNMWADDADSQSYVKYIQRLTAACRTKSGFTTLENELITALRTIITKKESFNPRGRILTEQITIGNMQQGNKTLSNTITTPKETDTDTDSEKNKKDQLYKTDFDSANKIPSGDNAREKDIQTGVLDLTTLQDWRTKYIIMTGEGTNNFTIQPNWTNLTDDYKTPTPGDLPDVTDRMQELVTLFAGLIALVNATGASSLRGVMNTIFGSGGSWVPHMSINYLNLPPPFDAIPDLSDLVSFGDKNSAAAAFFDTWLYDKTKLYDEKPELKPINLAIWYMEQVVFQWAEHVKNICILENKALNFTYVGASLNVSTGAPIQLTSTTRAFGKFFT